ncbi:MAG: NAD(P)/FAD-dependent oxidoreductase [Desulfobacteraceae bacterium]|nr:NAD(P)/FAD-dependent oxidoreductase [Desulfobacteraceae bacterium]
MMKTFDAVVVGGGPSGCAAAYDLAGAGLDVLVLDKKEFPRFKPCAGAVTIKALKLLRYSVTPVIKEVIYGKTVGMGARRETLLQGSNPICVTTIRSELDEFCLKQTLNQGADFDVIPGIKAIAEEKNSVFLTDMNGRVYNCKYLIGADGAHSQVRKITGQFRPDSSAIALEGIVPLEKCRSKPNMTFDYGTVRKGYGWLIPKRDHVNVGLYTAIPRKVKITREQLLDYTEKRIGTRDIEHIVGFPIGTGGEDYNPVSSRIFLVGDAAGFAEPLWGEGIHNAIKSGQAAAQAVAMAVKSGADAKQVYTTAVYDVKQDIQACRRFSNVFYNQLSISYALLKTRHVRTAVLEGFAAGMTVSEIKKKLLFKKSFIGKQLSGFFD